jgi:hypothetical protein
MPDVPELGQADDPWDEVENVIADALIASMKSGKSDRTMRDIEHIANAVIDRPDLLIRMLVDIGALVSVQQVARKKEDFFYLCADGNVIATEGRAAYVATTHSDDDRSTEGQAPPLS